jgi:hypothetical protein
MNPRGMLGKGRCRIIACLSLFWKEVNVIEIIVVVID